MNTKPVIFVITAMLSAVQCMGQSNVVYYGANSNALDVVFSDTNLSQKTQSAIIADLRVCLQAWRQETKLMLDDDEGSEVIGYLDIPRTRSHYPEDIDFPKHIISNGTSGVALQIPKELSDAYKKAFVLAAANAKAVTAANAFVEFVSSTNFLTLPPKNLSDYLLDINRTTKKVIADAQEIISDLRQQTYYPPSVLGFYYSKEGPASKNLWMLVPCSHGEEPLSWDPFTAIWHKGKWKFCIWQEKEE